MLDVINSVGLGESVLKLIERRQRMDIWVTYGGMVGACSSKSCCTMLLVVLP